MRSIPSIPNSVNTSLRSEAGFTLIELLVASTLGLVVTALVLGSLLTHRNLFHRDLTRTRVAETLRGAMDIMGADIRLGGEALPAAFPAILATNGASGAPDTLTVRRNVLSEVLPLCTALTSGSTAVAYFAITGSVAGCTYAGQTSSFNSWKNYRTGQGGTTKAFIWDSGAKAGEIFDYVGENDTGTTYSIRRTGAWSRAYPTTTTAIYMLEEWAFRQSVDELQLIKNQDTVNPVTLAFNVENFQLSFTMMDGTTKSAFLATDSWTQIRGIDLTLTAAETVGGDTLSRTLRGSYFPRNVLSN